MLKWQCRHRIDPYPIQFFPEDELDSEVKENKMPRIPKKINERQVEKAIRADKGLPA